MKNGKERGNQLAGDLFRNDLEEYLLRQSQNCSLYALRETNTGLFLTWQP